MKRLILLTLSSFELNYNVISLEQQVSVTMSYAIKKAMYPKEYYLKFKQYFDEYLNAMAQTIQVELSE